MGSNPEYLSSLSTLVLSKVSIFTKNTIGGLCDALNHMPNLKTLDISYNGILGYELS